MSENQNNNTCGTSCGCGPDTQVQGYWQDVENKVLDPKTLNQEFSDAEFDSFSVTKSRRSFLKIMGFSVSALPLTGCIKIPVKKALPYLHKNDTVIPGVANYYASTWKTIPVLVKTREGRPIKIEGNPLSINTKGGADANAQASVLSLYDSYRYRAPKVDGKDVEWDQFDKALVAELKSVAQTGKDIYLITSSVASPSELDVIREFTRTYGAKHVAYDAVSYSGWADANSITHGARALPEYDFSKADVVVSVGFDFLSGLNSVRNQKGYSLRRDPKGSMNKHIHVESLMSLAGSNADVRYTRTLEDQRNILLGILAEVSGSRPSGFTVAEHNVEVVKQAAEQLKAHVGTGLFLYGENCVNCQVIANKINDSLGNYGNTITVRSSDHVVAANDAEFENFVAEAAAGRVGAAVYLGVNPVYTHPEADKFKAAHGKIGTTVALALSEDETSTLCKYVAPTNHTYESWSDTLVGRNEISVTQPVIQPLFGTRMAAETLLTLAGNQETFHDRMKKFWKANFHAGGNFETFWNKTLHDGVVLVDRASTSRSGSIGDVSRWANHVASDTAQKTPLQTLQVYVKGHILEGAMSNNPWLQELPDPVTKATWDNYLMVSPSYARNQELTTGSVVEVKSGNYSVKVPVMVQPGTAEGTFGLALGYGRKVAGKVAKEVGVNAYPFVKYRHGSYQFAGPSIEVRKTGEERLIAQTQTHHSMEGRDIVRETTFDKYQVNPNAGNEKKAKLVHIYPEHHKTGHQWAMAIDLNKCTGCSACIVACNAENNVPVVGKVEVGRRREMHWLRLDRYYAGSDHQPEVVHMPMLCQHCDNAPCENVCPVLATVQSSDGLNQQVYNRCVGTRYCANNCPYKVRRFNWFTYKHEDEIENMVLNPDVTVRTRGVMEKCTMCVQRIQQGKLEAKRERRPLLDGEIQTACQQTCPSDAIVFGDMNDKNSKIAQYLEDERKYNVLAELNVQPRVSYMTKVRNR